MKEKFEFDYDMAVSIIKQAMSEGYDIKEIIWFNQAERGLGEPSYTEIVRCDTLFNESGQFIGRFPVNPGKGGCVEWNFVKADESLCFYHADDDKCIILDDAVYNFFTPDKDRLLAGFHIEYDGKETLFHIYGEYSEEYHTPLGGGQYYYPELENLSATVALGDGKEIPFSPAGCDFSGRKYGPEDMISGLICALIRGDKSYRLEYMEDGLKNIVDAYRRETVSISDTVCVPKHILNGVNFFIYELALATDQFIYYVAETEETVMLEAGTMEVVSDNYFAGEGLYESVERIKNGEETLLWDDGVTYKAIFEEV